MRSGMAIEVVATGVGTRAPGYEVPWRRLPFLLVEWGDGGAWELELEDAVHRVGAGAVLVVPPDVRHRLHAIGPTFTSRWLLLQVTHAGLPALRQAPLPPVWTGRRAQALRRAARRALAPRTTLAAAAAAAEACARLVHVLLQAAPALPLPGPVGRLEAWQVRVRQQCGEPLRRRDLARWARLSPSRLHTCCCTELGMGPMRYLRQVRLERARELLTTSRAPIRAVAAACGFPSLPHFARCFRAHHGLTATAYRAGHRLGP